MSFEEIRFDMSRDGLVELSHILEEWVPHTTEEVLNFINQVRNLVQRAPAAKESSWLDA